jgi:aldehyde dehydrogenase (NAD+)
VKPAEDACLSLLRVAELAADAGLPEGALNIVTGLGREAGAALAAHRGIAHLSFTGSPATGAWVASEAAKRHCPVTLELGGKGAQIVFADADLDAALPTIVNAIVQNAGQTCSAGSRLLVERSRSDEVLEKLGARFAALAVGPALADLDCGPLIRAGQLERVRGFLTEAERDGVAIVAKGIVAADAPATGYYIEPHLLRDVPPFSRLGREEVFGPVLAAMTFADEADAVRIANATDFGLVAGVWTRDGGRQMRMARAIRSGQVFVNCYGAGGGVELPFGGVKHSGYGREKGFEALYGFTVLKTVVLQHG